MDGFCVKIYHRKKCLDLSCFSLIFSLLINKDFRMMYQKITDIIFFCKFEKNKWKIVQDVWRFSVANKTWMLFILKASVFLECSGQKKAISSWLEQMTLYFILYTKTWLNYIENKYKTAHLSPYFIGIPWLLLAWSDCLFPVPDIDIRLFYWFLPIHMTKWSWLAFDFGKHVSLGDVSVAFIPNLPLRSWETTIFGNQFCATGWSVGNIWSLR